MKTRRMTRVSLRMRQNPHLTPVHQYLWTRRLGALGERISNNNRQNSARKTRGKAPRKEEEGGTRALTCRACVIGSFFDIGRLSSLIHGNLGRSRTWSDIITWTAFGVSINHMFLEKPQMGLGVLQLEVVVVATAELRGYRKTIFHGHRRRLDVSIID
jgi:hypothetical protein